MTASGTDGQLMVGGCAAESQLQEEYGTTARAQAFYRNQVIDHLNPAMREFIGRQEMVFIATADQQGEADCSFRAGPPGFVRILSEGALCYPEYRGNGILASLGNISENPHIGLLFVDFGEAKIGLHVNGRARVVENEELAREATTEVRADLAETGGRRSERWVVVSVDEAYVHCSKHIPKMRKVGDQEIAWGTDDVRAKGGDYFGVRAAKQM
jgi:predicted pyridoxine 5'-phosphate oxidase superfamily flavin-nucleotide-binding protein